MSVRDEVLYLVAIDGVVRPFLARKEGVLEDGKDEAAQRERLIPEFPFLEIDDDPMSFAHRLFHRERRAKMLVVLKII
jgi:hypothetical protein